MVARRRSTKSSTRKSVARVVSETRSRGRPTSYDPKYARTAKKLCQLGATDADLASAFGVTTPTIWAWKNRHREFFDALTEKEAFDSLAERGLAQRAVGYTYDTEEIKLTRDGKVLRIPTRKHVPPDVTACIFWLKNRRPAQWRDVNRFEHTGADGGPVEVKDVREEIERRIAGIAARLAQEADPSQLN